MDLDYHPLDKEDCEAAIMVREQLNEDQWTKLIFAICARARKRVNAKKMN